MAHQATVLFQVRRLLQTQQTRRLQDIDLLELFRRQNNEDAFAELVRRHGPLVLGVCQRVLHNAHDADDVFQATFLVLARKSGSIRKQGSLSSWLHGVAYRLSLKCRTGTQRRRRQELPFLDYERSTCDEVQRRELQAVLDEELQRLPERQRAPLLLCYAEGKSQHEAARDLGWSRGTLKRRLEQGRQILRDRLTRRGVALSAGAAAALAQPDLRAAVPPALAATTTKLATLMTAPEAPAVTAASAKVALLANGMMKSMCLGKVRTAAAALLMLGLLGTSAGVVAHQMLAENRAEVSKEAYAQPIEGAETKQTEHKTARLDLSGEPLPDEALARFGSTHLKHSGHSIGFLGFTPDGKTLVSQGSDDVRTWEVATGRQLHQTAGAAASLSPNGKYLATASGKAIHIREVATGNMVCTLGAGAYSFLCFSPDGKSLASAGHPDLAHVDLWDFRTGAQLRSWSTDGGASVTALVFTPDAKTLIAAQTDKTIRFWAADTGKELQQASVAPSDRAKIAISPDGALLAVLGERRVVIEAGRSSFAMPNELEKGIRIVDVASGKEVRQLSVAAQRNAFSQSKGFTALAFSPDGKSLLAGDIDDSVFVWDLATGKELRRYLGGFAKLQALTVAPDGNTVAAAIGGKTIRLFDLKEGQDLFRASGHQDGVSRACLPSSGNLAATNAGEKTILVWDAASGQEFRRLEGHTGRVTDLKLAADDRTLISQGADETIRFWDLASGKELSKLAFEGTQHYGLAVSPDGKTVAVPSIELRSPDGKAAAVPAYRLCLYDCTSGKPRWSAQGEDPWWGTAFSSDGQSLIAWSGIHTVQVRDVATGRDRRRFALNPAGPVPGQNVNAQVGQFYISYSAQASADGKWIAYANQTLVNPVNHYLLILDVANGKVVRRLDGLKDGAFALAFSPDSKTLAWGSVTAPTIHLLELATGKERHHLSSPGGGIASLAFAADGRRLISGKDDTTALVWDLTGKLAAGASWGKPLAPAELHACWSDLAGDDAARSYRAIRRLAASPAQAIPFLGDRLHPATAVDRKQFDKWIADLDSSDFKTRARAAGELGKLEDDISGLYRQVLEGKPSSEVKRRVEELLENHVHAWLNPNPERLRILRTLEVLELAATAEARRIVETLAYGAPAARLTGSAKESLDRLARNERNAE